MYQLSELKKYSENYDVNHLNCMERPFVAALNSYNPVYRSLFIIILKMSQCYRIRSYEKDLYSEFRTIKKAKYILKKVFNIELSEVTCCPENINKTIEKILDNNNPVFVPGNLIELFYSKFYKTNDWMHLFLIKGYDSSKKIFQILDATQRRDELDYNCYDFVITYDILENMYISFCEAIYQEKIYFISSDKIDRSPEANNILLNILDLFCFGLDEEPYNEVIELKQNALDCDYLFRLANYKEAFLSQLIVALKCSLNTNVHIVDFEQDVKRLIEKWKGFDRKLIYNRLKNNHHIIENSLNEIIELEEKLRDKCKCFINELKQHKCVCYKDKSDRPYSIENNEDDIIKYISNNGFEFNFDGRKFYNSWFSDDSPKVTFKIPKYKPNSFLSFESNFKIINNSQAQSYMIGIFFRDKSRKKYFWGINCGTSLLFENTGINSNITEKFEILDEYRLGFCINDNKVKLYYYNASNKKIFIETNIVVNETIIDYGIECKTWDKPQKLIFETNQLKLNNCEIMID